MFRKILWRSVLAPLVGGLISCALFVILTLYVVDSQKWVEHTESILAKSTELQKRFVNAEASLRGFVITSEEKFLTPYNVTLKTWEKEAAELKEIVKDNPVQLQRLREISESFKNYISYSEKVFVAHKLGSSKSAAIVSTEEGRILMDQIRTAFVRFENMERDLLKERSRKANDSSRLFLVFLVGGTLFVALTSALWGRKQIIDLSKSYEELTEDQLQQKRGLERNQWLKDHQNQLMALMMGNINIHEFSDRILNFFTEILGAQAGSFFVKIESGSFRRISDLGLLENGRQRQSQFDLGQGFLGSLLKREKIEVVRDLPANYFQLSSGLGEADAKIIAIIPVTAREELIGGLELGFLAEPAPKVLEFLEAISEPLGTVLQSIQDNQKLEKLYHEIQNQAEELQAQEEELRVSNEELETQMRLVRESQAHTETQNLQLNETNYQLQSQALILEEQKNLLESRNIELLQIRSEVEKKAQELERASRYKSEFLANMSHELRTPLNSTLILAQLLIDNKDQHLDDKEVEYAKHILTSGNDLLLLINDILDLSKVESGKLDLHFSTFRVNSLIRTLKNTFTPLANSKGVHLQIEEQKEDYEINTDRIRLEQILKNLLSNAVKFTDKGFVRLELHKNEDGLKFHVSDSGIGIQAEHQHSIFEAFKQADGTTSRKYGGTGLGLSISQTLSQLLGGAISMTSIPGEGSTFTLTIPLQPAAKAREFSRKAEYSSYTSPTSGHYSLPLADKAITSRKFVDDDRNTVDKQKDEIVLIVEDDPQFAKIMRDLVYERDLRCVVCDTAEAALSISREYRLKFVILDIQLPDHSGLIVLDQLKRNSKTRYVPVQVISGKDFAAQAYELGAVGYTLKPVVKDRLERIFSELEGKFKRPSRKVLIVEDDQTQQMALKALLEDEFLKTTTVETGKETLTILKEENFDCVVMDLSLPDMTGFQILQTLAEDKNFDCPPIIIYTGRDLSSSEERELKRYSGTIIVKGARSPERLLDEVMLYLYRMDSSLPPSHQKILKSIKDKDLSLEGKRILLTDDDMRNIFALASGLERKGAMITIAKDGIEAIDALKTNPNIDIVLMDIMMPNMDGYAAIGEIRKDKKYNNLPIIAVTAKAMKDDRDKALAMGADDYISKPVDMERLISLIRIWTMRVS